MSNFARQAGIKVALLFIVLAASWGALRADLPDKPAGQISPSVQLEPEADAERFLNQLASSPAASDESALRRMLDAFNERQRALFNADDDSFVAPKGYTQLQFADFGAFFAIEQIRTVASHTQGIDDGIDVHEMTFFARAPLREIVRLPGPAYPFANRGLVMLVPAKDSCLGERIPEGEILVYDLRRNAELFRAKLPPGTLVLDEVGSQKENSIQFSVASETELPAARQGGCEVGSRVRITHSRVALHCDASRKACWMSRKVLSVKEDCQWIGGCD